MTLIQSLHKNNLSKMICHVTLQETQVIKRHKSGTRGASWKIESEQGRRSMVAVGGKQ